MPQNMRNIIKVQLHFIEFCIPCKFWIVSQCELFTEWIVVSFSFIFCYCSAAVLCRRKTNDRAKLLGWNRSPLLFPETLIDSSCHGSSKKMVFLLFFCFLHTAQTRGNHFWKVSPAPTVLRCFCTKFLKTPALQNHCRTTRAMKVGSSNANANTSEMSLKVRGVKRVKLHL